MEIVVRNQQRRRWLCVIAGLLAVYLAWRRWHGNRSPYAALSRRGRLSQLYDIAKHVSDIVSVTSEVGALLVRDAQRFLTSDAEEVPRSMKQGLKLLTSVETLCAVSKLAGSAFPSSSGPSALDKVIQATLSDKGQNLVSLVVAASSARMADAFSNALMEASCRQSDMRGPSSLEIALNWLSSQDGQRLLSGCMTAFVSEGMRVYCDKTAGLNTYEDFFQAASRPEHLKVLRTVTESMCKACVDSAAAAVTPLLRAPDEPTAVSASCPSADEPKLALLHEHGLRDGTCGKERQHRTEADCGTLGEGPGSSMTGALITLSRSPDVRALCCEVTGSAVTAALDAGFERIRMSGYIHGGRLNRDWHRLRLFLASVFVFYMLTLLHSMVPLYVPASDAGALR